MCTMRLYCAKYKGNSNPKSCRFSITLKLQGTVWSIADSYNVQKMCHNHSINLTDEDDDDIMEDSTTVEASPTKPVKKEPSKE